MAAGLLAIVLLVLLASTSATDCLGGPCEPGNDFCGAPFTGAPAYHLMDQHGCGEVRAASKGGGFTWMARDVRMGESIAISRPFAEKLCKPCSRSCTQWGRPSVSTPTRPVLRRRSGRTSSGSTPRRRHALVTSCMASAVVWQSVQESGRSIYLTKSRAPLRLGL